MNKATLKSYLILITYAVILLIALFNWEKLFGLFSVIFGAFVPIIWGFGIAFVLNLLMKLFEDRIFHSFWLSHPRISKFKRLFSLTLTYLTVSLFIVLLSMFVFPQVYSSMASLSDNLPEALSKTEIFFDNLVKKYSLTPDLLNQLPENIKEIFQTLGGFATVALTYALGLTKVISISLFHFFLGLIFSIYMLYSKEKLLRIITNMILAFIPEKASKEIFYLARESNTTFSKFIGGQLTEALILGTLCTVGLIIMQMPYALLIGVIIGVTSLIPILGVYLGAIPSAFILLINEPIQALWFIIFLAILQQFEGNVIYPKVVGGALGLSGLWILAAITIGGSLGGILGMLLGVPAMAVIYTVVRRLTYERL